MTSSTHERKSKTSIVTKKGLLYLHHNTLTENVPVCIVLKVIPAHSLQPSLA